MDGRRGIRGAAVGLAIAAIVAGAGVPGVAQAESVPSISFEGSVSGLARDDRSHQSALTVTIDDASALNHPNAMVWIRPTGSGGEPPLFELSGMPPKGCHPGDYELYCEVDSVMGGVVTQWSLELSVNSEVAESRTTYVASLIDGDEELASAEHTVEVYESQGPLASWNETVTTAPGQVATFAPSYHNNTGNPLAGVVITVIGDVKAPPVDDYDNCVLEGVKLTCVVPEAVLSAGSTVAVSAATPLGVRLAEQGPYDQLCADRCHQFAEVVGIAEARSLLEWLGGGETGNVLELVPAERPGGDPAPAPQRYTSLFIQVAD